MGNTGKAQHEDETSSQILKRKNEIEFAQDDFIRQVEGSLEIEYQILLPPLMQNEFYEMRKVIHRRTTLIRAVFIINKYKIRSQQRQLLQIQITKLKRIDHPNLVKIYELYKDSHRFYIVCELCFRQSLCSVLEIEGSLPERMAANIMKQLLQALDYCQSKNVIHSDLNLQNIGFNSNKQQVLKIADFSISRIFRLEQIIQQCRRKAIMLAPENLNLEITHKSDIWACGVILYILLCGEPPFLGKDKKKMNQTFIYCKNSPILVQPEFKHPKFKFISKEAKSLIKQMLRYNSEERYSARQCLQHPWINKFYHCPVLPSTTMKRCLVECYNYNVRTLIYRQPSSKLQEACWAFFVNILVTFEEKQDIWKVFTKLDKNFKGELSEEDLLRGFTQIYNSQKSAFLSRYIMSKQKRSTIRFSQFVTLCSNRQFLISSQNINKIFKILDEDSSGEVSVGQLKDILGSSKEVTEEVWLQLMKQADSNSDGMISLNEFIDMMRGLKNKNNQILVDHISQQSTDPFTH